MLLGVTHTDTADVAARLADKTWTLRILSGETSCERGVHRSRWSANSRSTPTPRKGRRPSWQRAAPPGVGEPLVERTLPHLRKLGADVATGVFGARWRSRW